MKKFYAIVLLMLPLLLWTPIASACGDKLLHLSRIHRPGGMSNASVILFSRPSSLLENAANSQLAKAFQNAGHRLVLVDSEQDLMATIKAGNADVVIVDVADLPLLRDLRSSTRLSVVAVVNKADRQGERDGKQCDAMVKTPAKPGKLVDAVDDALDAKVAHQGSNPSRQSLFSR